MTITCPACDEELDVEGAEQLAVGDQLQCAECGEMLEVSEMVGGGVSAVESTMGGDEDDEPCGYSDEDQDDEDDEDEDEESDLDIDDGDDEEY